MKACNILHTDLSKYFQFSNIEIWLIFDADFVEICIFTLHLCKLSDSSIEIFEFKIENKCFSWIFLFRRNDFWKGKNRKGFLKLWNFFVWTRFSGSMIELFRRKISISQWKTIQNRRVYIIHICIYFFLSTQKAEKSNFFAVLTIEICKIKFWQFAIL